MEIKKIILSKFLITTFLLASNVDYKFFGPNGEYRYITYDKTDNKPIFLNNTLKWYYNPANQSYSKFSQEEVIDTIKKAMSSWSNVCNIKFEYMGTTTNDITDYSDDMVTIGYFSENEFVSEYGEYAGYSYMFWNGNKIIYEASMVLNAGDQGIYYTPTNLTDLQGLITHEIGHLLGIDHSDDSNSIMYANPYHTYSYQSILRDDDIAIARVLYPYSSDYESGYNEAKEFCKNNPSECGIEIPNINESLIYTQEDMDKAIKECDTKELIDNSYIETLSNGWHLLGTSEDISINNLSVNYDIWRYEDGYWDYAPEAIKKHQGFWIKK